jgi:hypothetical protein
MNDLPAIAFFVFSVLFALFALWLTLPSKKGTIGEYFVKKQLEKLAKKYQGLSFHNLMLGTGDQSTQLDNLLITSKAVYVIEVKNYAGRVYGGQYQDQWYQTIRYDNKRRGRGGRIYTKTHIAKNSFFNPIKQNLIHVNAIKQSIQSIQSLPLFNVVVFMNRTNITNVEMKDDTAYVINRRHLRRLVKQKEKELNTQSVDLARIQDEFTKKNTFSKANLKKHIRKIKEKYNKS